MTAIPSNADIDSATAAFEKLLLDDGSEQDGQDLPAAHKEYEESESKLSKGDENARKVARSLSHKQIKWLAELPVVLRLGSIPRGTDHPNFEDLLVVHAGLVPNVALEDQDPWAVMNMRTISYPANDMRRDAVRKFLEERVKRLGGAKGKLAALQAIDDSMVDEELQKILRSQGLENMDGEAALPSSGRDGVYWYEEWSRLQEKLVKKDKKKGKKDKKGHKKHSEDDDAGPITTVVYGHDAKSGLRVPKEYGKGKKGYTFGLDSGCVYGGQLTALVIKIDNGQAVHEIVQVDCAQHVKADE